MPSRSAGLLMYRWHDQRLEVFLVHPGGPFWTNKDLGAWSIPKGEYDQNENPLAAAQREFTEETGFTAHGNFVELGTLKQAGGKLVSAWAFRGDCDPAKLIANRFQLEWPPRSGKQVEFPEVDRGAWFSLAEAEERILKSQRPFLHTLQRELNPDP